MREYKGEHELWDFSYVTPKTATDQDHIGEFRFVNEDTGEKLFSGDRMSGFSRLHDVDNVRGRLKIITDIQVKDRSLHCYLYDYNPVCTAQGEVYGDEDKPAHLRLCFNHAGKTWRLLDEEKGIRITNDLATYRGDINMSWFDKGPHIHHSGVAVIDAEGNCHFGERVA